MSYSAQYGTAVYGDSSYGVLLLTAGSGTYTITGGDASFDYDQVLQGNAGSYTLTGADAGLLYSQRLECEAGSYTLTGNSNTFLYNQTIYAGAFSFIWSGQQAGLVKDAKLDANSGSYLITGGSATFLRDRMFSCNAGSYTFTGKTAALSYNPDIGEAPSRGGLPAKKVKTKVAKNQHEDIAAIVKREFDILDGTYQPEVVEKVKDVVIPQIKQIDLNEYNIAIAQVNALLLQAKIQAAEYESELDDEEALLMLL